MAADPFAYTADKVAAVSAGKKRAESYDVYNDFPTLKNGKT